MANTDMNFKKNINSKKKWKNLSLTPLYDSMMSFVTIKVFLR